MSRRTRVPAERRRPQKGITLDLILDIAKVLFREQGYDATSVRDIAERLGIRKGSLYNHITRKSEILQLLLLRSINELVEMAQGVVAEPLPAEQKLVRLIEGQVRLMAAHQDEVVIYLVERLRKRSLVEDTARRSDIYSKLVAEVVRQGIREGAWAPCDPELATLAILGMVGWFATWYNPYGRLSVEEIARQLARMAVAVLHVGRQDGQPHPDAPAP